MSNVQIGFGLFPGPDGKKNAVLQVSEDHVNFAVTFTNEDNADHDIAEIIKGLQQLRADLRIAKSGLVISKEAIPNAGSIQGRPAHSQGSPRIQGPRPPKG